jgi:hypothetical protein
MPSGALSPFYPDNMFMNVNDSARDLDGRKLVEFLGYGVDLAKYGPVETTPISSH